MSHVPEPAGAARPTDPAVPDLRLVDWAPLPQVSVPATRVQRAAVPAVDVHNHLGRWLTTDWCAPDVAELLGMMDDAGIETVVNLDGLWGDELEANLDRYDRAHPGRFLTFCQVDWTLLRRSTGPREIQEQLRDSAARGARGLKVWKNVGLTVVGPDGELVLPDDQRVIDVLALAGELGLPALVHVADPKAFFDPLDAHNERFDELAGQPDWSFADRDRYPSFDRLLDAFEALAVATPGTRYIGAHVGCVAEDLDRVERLLRAVPHLVVDIAGRLAELGRQPRRFRRLVESFPERVLFGTDAFPLSPEQLEVHFRFLETDDECFDYAPGEDVPPQGRWQISGAGLPAHLLPDLYAGNARRVLGLDGN
ncbi:amidohydrolase family protein [Promicromonospora sp. NPDC023987]|uniref:amidohydrolase family protein n=1 Tax=Promicromonospora sp. NPDC023987 TaxID=3155360 RepID=UPI0033C50B15